VLSDLSKLTQSKVICSNGIHFILGTHPVNITGYVQSINSNNDKIDIAEDRLLDFVHLQILINNWTTIGTYAFEIKRNRDNWMENQIRPRTEYHIWGYANPNANITTGILQAGHLIRLDNQTYKIKEISYESETMQSIKSFEAVCIRD
jgi:hypothetical protein